MLTASLYAEWLVSGIQFLRVKVASVSDPVIECHRRIRLQLAARSLCKWILDRLDRLQYLNNIVEQDHRAVKRVTTPMLNFKSFQAAKCVLAGIELMHMIRKGPLMLEGCNEMSFPDPVLPAGRTNPSYLGDQHSSQPEVRSSAANATQPEKLPRHPDTPAVRPLFARL